MSWKADYNIVAPETSDTTDIVGWVTLDNQSGKTFENAHIKLMAGDVSKIQEQNSPYQLRAMAEMVTVNGAPPIVTQKTFDEYHLYTLARMTVSCWMNSIADGICRAFAVTPIMEPDRILKSG